MKKLNLLIFIIGIMLLTACNDNDEGAKTPTGYASNEIEQPQLM